MLTSCMSFCYLMLQLMLTGVLGDLWSCGPNIAFCSSGQLALAGA